MAISLDDVGDLDTRGENNNAKVWQGIAQALCDLQTILTRQINVQHNDVWCTCLPGQHVIKCKTTVDAGCGQTIQRQVINQFLA